MTTALKVFFIILLCVSPVFSKGKQESYKGKSPLQAYYAGRVEQAADGFKNGRSTGDKSQLVVLLWEMGEMHKAAELLEDLLKEKDLSAAERGELQTQLFYTYALIGAYNKATPLRANVERFVQGKDARIRAEFLFYSAFVFEETGNADRAIELYKRSVELNKWRPIAWYRLGMLLRNKDPKEAEKCLKTCWDQDASFNDALLPLARLHMNRKDWRAAGNYLYTAHTRFPDNREVSNALTEVRKHIYVGPWDGTYLIRRAITAKPPKVIPAPATREGTMRIGLIEKKNLVSVKPGGEFTIQSADGKKTLYSGKELEQFWVEASGKNSLVIHDKDKKELLKSSVPVVYKLNANDNSSILAGVVNGAPGINRTYRGHMEFRPGEEGITVVNIVPVEDYLYGVVPAEMPASWPTEALKAQAIAARSYAIAYRGKFADRGFDIFGTPHSQAYHGVGVEHKRTSDAVSNTRNIILLGGNKRPLSAYYSANHGGYSEDSLTLWGYDAYMQSVPDKLLPIRTKPLMPEELYRWVRDTPSTYSNIPRFSYISAYRWEKWVRPEEIRRRLKEDPGEITRIITRGRGISGRIAELEVKGKNKSVMVKGDAIWSSMGGLRSSLFTIRYKLDKNGNVEYFVFQGAGFGHGIGMDQHGAAGMANAGLSVEEILAHYYPRAQQGRL